MYKQVWRSTSVDDDCYAKKSTFANKIKQVCRPDRPKRQATADAITRDLLQLTERKHFAFIERLLDSQGLSKLLLMYAQNSIF